MYLSLHGNNNLFTPEVLFLYLFISVLPQIFWQNRISIKVLKAQYVFVFCREYLYIIMHTQISQIMSYIFHFICSSILSELKKKIKNIDIVLTQGRIKGGP